MARLIRLAGHTALGTPYEILLETEERRTTWEGVRALYPACHACVRIGGRIHAVGKACRPDAVADMTARARLWAEDWETRPASEPEIDLAAWK